jgi:hypothetical protein
MEKYMERDDAPVQKSARTLGKFFDVARYQRVQDEIQKQINQNCSTIETGQRPGVLGMDEPLRILQMVQSI